VVTCSDQQTNVVITIVHADPDPASGPLVAVFSPATLSRSNHHPRELRVSGVPCSGPHAVLFDVAGTGAAFTPAPVLFDTGNGPNLGDGVYSGSVTPSRSARKGVHTIGVQCDGRFVATARLRVATGSSVGAPIGTGPINPAPRSRLAPATLIVGWTYDAANPYRERLHGANLTLRWPACHGTRILFPGGRVYASTSDAPATLRHGRGARFAGRVYVGASQRRTKALHGLRCVGGGKVLTYGTLPVRLQHRSTRFPALTVGDRTVVTLRVPRCRDPRVTTVSLAGSALTAAAVLDRDPGTTAFAGPVAGNPGASGPATLSCGGGVVGTLALRSP
jgi:hypothetical protein